MASTGTMSSFMNYVSLPMGSHNFSCHAWLRQTTVIEWVKSRAKYSENPGHTRDEWA